VKLEKATFGAGCFWNIEDTFKKVKGVVKTRVGYAGGNTKNPTYARVCTGITGHAESVEITYDPKIISYEKLLDIFWKSHNPTQKNRQGFNIGTEYRSIIFYHNKKQEELAIKSKEKLQKSKKYNKNIVTEIKPIKIFSKAEEYHQEYLEKRRSNPNMLNKLKKLISKEL